MFNSARSGKIETEEEIQLRLAKIRQEEEDKQKRLIEEEQKRKKEEFDKLTPNQQKASLMFDDCMDKVYKEFNEKNAKDQ